MRCRRGRFLRTRSSCRLTRTQRKHHVQQHPEPFGRRRPLSKRLAIAIGASLLGLSLVYFAGFSHIEAVHNAAHDTRHSSAFPCH